MCRGIRRGWLTLKKATALSLPAAKVEAKGDVGGDGGSSSLKPGAKVACSNFERFVKKQSGGTTLMREPLGFVK